MTIKNNYFFDLKTDPVEEFIRQLIVRKYNLFADIEGRKPEVLRIHSTLISRGMWDETSSAIEGKILGLQVISSPIPSAEVGLISTIERIPIEDLRQILATVRAMNTSEVTDTLKLSGEKLEDNYSPEDRANATYSDTSIEDEVVKDADDSCDSNTDEYVYKSKERGNPHRFDGIIHVVMEGATEKKRLDVLHMVMDATPDTYSVVLTGPGISINLHKAH